jgi:antitoxin component YwqK of YwqJK toxin-antitoxin module
MHYKKRFYRPMKKLLFVSLVLFVSGCVSKKPSNGNDELVCMQIVDRNGMNETISAKDRLEKYKNINFLESQPYKQVVRIFKSNAPQKSSIITTYHPNGLIYQYLEVANARACGKYRQWHPNGKLEIEATVIGGPAGISELEQKGWIFDKKSYVCDENGSVISMFNYDKGNLEGPSYFYYPQGQIKKMEPYHNNEIEGEVLEYSENGEIISKTYFKEGKKDGIAEGYFEKDKYSYTEQYAQDHLIEGKYFDRDGKLLSQIKNGEGLKTIFLDEDGKLISEYTKGILEGKISYYKNSILQSFYHLKEGKKHGEEIEYYSNGSTPKISIQWADDSIHGTVKTWYSDGNLESQKEMYDNKKNGTSTAWYKSGRIMLIEEYEQDHLIKGAYYKNNENIPISTILNGRGTATLYDEKGNFIKSIKYQNGYPEIE